MPGWLSSRGRGMIAGAARDAVWFLVLLCPTSSLALGATCGLGYCRLFLSTPIRFGFSLRRSPGSWFLLVAKGKRDGDAEEEECGRRRARGRGGRARR